MKQWVTFIIPPLDFLIIIIFFGFLCFFFVWKKGRKNMFLMGKMEI